MPSARTTERTQRERTEATTGSLIAAARARFARDGYAAAPLDEIAADAGVSKGALYHHFPGGKAELFRAVYEAEQRRIAHTTSRAFLREKDPWEGLYAGCRAFLEGIADRGLQRIILVEGPAVLGHEAVREVEERFAVAQMKEAITRAIDAGIIPKRRVEPLAYMLFGAVCQAAGMTARATDPRASARHALTELRTLLSSMRVVR